MRDYKLRKRVFNDFIDGEKLEKKTSAMTAPVGVDADGKLWTSGGGSGGEDETIIWSGTVGSEPMELSLDVGQQFREYLEFLDIKINGVKSEYSAEYFDDEQSPIMTAEYYSTIGDAEITLFIDLNAYEGTVSLSTDSETQINVTVKIPTKAIITCRLSSSNDSTPNYAIGSIINVMKIGIQPVLYFVDSSAPRNKFAYGSIVSVSMSGNTFAVDGSISTFEGGTVNYSTKLLNNIIPCLRVKLGGTQ